MSKLFDQITRAKIVSVPFVCITTPDPTNLATSISEAVGKSVDDRIKALGEKVDGRVQPLTTIRWDVSKGFHTGRSKNLWDERGEAWIKEQLPAKDDDAAAAFGEDHAPESIGAGQPASALEMLQTVPPGTVVFFMGAERWLTGDTAPGKSAIQAAANLRHTFEKGRSQGSMIVFMGHEISLPLELRADTIFLDDPLPTTEQLLGLFEGNKFLADSLPDKRDRDKAAAAVTGCSLFGARQAMYLACKRVGPKVQMDLSELRELRHRQIEQTKGLKVIGGEYDFSYVAGHDYTKNLMREVMQGNDPPNGLINVEEINMALAGSTGDNTGVSQDQVMILLDTMEKRGDEGIIFFGVPGCSKSWIVECCGNEFGVDTLQLDLNDLKSENVGSSEQNIRQALKVADAVCGGRKLWIATCNSVADMSDALLRRFTFGIIYFDLLTDEEKKSVWEIQLKMWGDRLGDKAKWSKLTKGWENVDTDLWSGADIRNCCRHTYKRNRPLVSMALEANPVARQRPHMLDKYRKPAHQCYRQSHTGKLYVWPKAPKGQESVALPESERVVVL